MHVGRCEHRAHSRASPSSREGATAPCPAGGPVDGDHGGGLARCCRAWRPCVDPQLVRERTQISQPLRGEKRGNPTRHVRLALGVHGSTCRLCVPLEAWASGRVGEELPRRIGRRVCARWRAHLFPHHLAGAPFADVQQKALVLMELFACDRGCAGGQV